MDAFSWDRRHLALANNPHKMADSGRHENIAQTPTRETRDITQQRITMHVTHTNEYIPFTRIAESHAYTPRESVSTHVLLKDAIALSLHRVLAFVKRLFHAEMKELSA